MILKILKNCYQGFFMCIICMHIFGAFAISKKLTKTKCRLQHLVLKLLCCTLFIILQLLDMLFTLKRLHISYNVTAMLYLILGTKGILRYDNIVLLCLIFAPKSTVCNCGRYKRIKFGQCHIKK